MPLSPELVLHAGEKTPEVLTDEIIVYLHSEGIIAPNEAPVESLRASRT
jgi:hypothetical protein